MGRHSRASQVAAGVGAGSGVLLDINGEIGRISMSVILVPFPHQTKPEPAEGPVPASNWPAKGATSVSARFVGANWIQVNVT
jgi:hypothetical protein